MFGDMLHAMKHHVTEMTVRMSIVSPEVDLQMSNVYNEASASHADAGSLSHGDAAPEPLAQPQPPESSEEPEEVTSPIVNIHHVQCFDCRRNDSFIRHAPT